MNFPTGHAINGTYPINDCGIDIFRFNENTRISFEIFPPKNQNQKAQLTKAVKKLKLNSPDFFSVTYGTGDGVADLSLDTIKMLKSHSDKNILAHITFSETSKHETLEIVSKLNEIGISSFLAIRGDSRFENKLSADNYFKDTVEFVETLKKTVSCDVSVAAYPDIHQSSHSLNDDIDWLMRKFDAGASQAITQFFFNADNFFRLRDAMAKKGYFNPIIPGVLAFENIENMLSFANKCHVQIPSMLKKEFIGNKDIDTHTSHCLAVLLDLCGKLGRGGVDRFHFFTLNKSYITNSLVQLMSPDAKNLELSEVSQFDNSSIRSFVV